VAKAKKIPKLAFRSKRFSLRAYRASDYRAWRSAYISAFPKQNDFDQEKKTEGELSLKAYQKFLRLNKKHSESGAIHHFGVFEKRTGRLMGFVLFALITRFNVQSARISYTVFNNYWKHGYGKEIVGSSLDFGFRKLKLHRIEAEILPANRASIALAKGLGFQFEGLRRGAVYFDHKWHDHLVYAILAEDVGMKKVKPVIFS
jgi:ribosomal-protein-alanine N-acetyltransferase